MGYRVVVAGATGNVGREMLAILAEREFPIDDIAVLASSRSTGDQVEFGEGRVEGRHGHRFFVAPGQARRGLRQRP